VAKYLGKRFVALVAIVFLVSVGAFYLVHLLPGDPTVAILGPNDTAHNKAILMAQLGLNKPLYEQYFIWRATSSRATSASPTSPTRPCSPPWRRRCPSTSS